MIEAGSETTSSTLNSCLLYLLANPQVQKSAQSELDTLPQSRSPTFSDEPSLPYIRAIVKEILRLRPVANIGSPRKSDEDVVYKDMFIPRGTNITLFQYAIQYNPERWREPERFLPERYLEYPLRSGDYAGIGNFMKRDHFSFGVGRRIWYPAPQTFPLPFDFSPPSCEWCFFLFGLFLHHSNGPFIPFPFQFNFSFGLIYSPGMHLAENSLFITIARILWAFDILPGLDSEGKEIPADIEAYEPGLSLTCPKPFKARFVPRSEEKRRLIVEEWKTAQKEGYVILGDKVRMA